MNDNNQNEVSAESVELDELPATDNQAVNQPVENTETVSTPATDTTTSVNESDVFNQFFPKEIGNSELVKPIFLHADKKNTDPHILDLPGLAYNELEGYVKSIPDNGYRAGEAEAWATSVSSSFATLYPENFLVRPSRSKTRKWTQGVKTERGTIGFSVPTYKDSQIGNLTGKPAVLRMRALLGMGHVEQIALWHSGFHITLQTPTDHAVIELNRRLSEEKIRLGRETWGYAFSNSSVYMVKHLMDFALEHVYTSTLNTVDHANIRKHISSLDIPHIAWGMACMLYAKGFKYRRAILDENQNTTEYVDEVLNVHNMQIVDTSQLTEWQISHMANRNPHQMSSESVKRYRDEFKIGKGTQYSSNENVKINIGTPSLEKYIVNGTMWVNGIVAMVNEAFNSEPGTDERNNIINLHNRASILRQYGHMVESIVIGESEVTDQETINSMLTDLSSNNLLRDEFFKAVKNYIEDATVALICIPSIPGKEISMEVQRFANLLPIDAVHVFFTLLEEKLVQITNRR